MPTLVSRLASQQLVAILDPPRAGLREWLPPQGLPGPFPWWVALGTPVEVLCLLRLQGGPGCAPSREPAEAAVCVLQPAGSHGQLRRVSVGSGGWLGAWFAPAGGPLHPYTDHAPPYTVSAGPRPTASRALPSGQSRLWPWTCSLRPRTVRCSFSLRGWSTPMVRGPWSPTSLWSRPHQHPQVIPRRKPGPPQLLRGCKNQPFCNNTWTATGRAWGPQGLPRMARQPQRPPSLSLTPKWATRTGINKC